MSNQWPHIGRFLWVDDLTGQVDDDFQSWSWQADENLTPAERAAGYEEWADFWEWCLDQSAAELADDRRKRHLVEGWTDSMVYCCRRSAARARGDDPGEWVPQHVRRPDLDAESREIAAAAIAE